MPRDVAGWVDPESHGALDYRHPRLVAGSKRLNVPANTSWEIQISSIRSARPTLVRIFIQQRVVLSSACPLSFS